jgi:hypothetical protein
LKVFCQIFLKRVRLWDDLGVLDSCLISTRPKLGYLTE